jgi:ketosteroid isomerase-like protein
MGAVENKKGVKDLYAALGPQDTAALAALVAEDEEDRSDV